MEWPEWELWEKYSQGYVAQPRSGRRSTGGGSGSRAGRIECWKCGKVGHKKEECRKMQCYECKEYGHRSYECPKKKYGGVVATAAPGAMP